MNYERGLRPSACGLPVYLYDGAGWRRGGVRRIQLSMCKHSSRERLRKWLFSCPLFLTRNLPLENIGRSLMALLWPKQCFVYAYWQNISVLWHVYTGTRINWKRNASVLAGTSRPFHASAPRKALRIPPVFSCTAPCGLTFGAKNEIVLQKCIRKKK